jgi:hypothetical protein
MCNQDRMRRKQQKQESHAQMRSFLDKQMQVRPRVRLVLCCFACCSLSLQQVVMPCICTCLGVPASKAASSAIMIDWSC